ncbi:MAG: alternative ribosome rescue aminoacyl-tRNA hydrolase ArfB [Candidatus Sericytochromatia bacterium]|nr:alternative ribosome rescue aminoacyl-tRNA hydrolase ArfB [Candidatus Sericytochromatia bacterium]
MPDVYLAPGVWVSEDALSFRASRSGGPGGQHVNKVASKIELRVPIHALVGINDAARTRLENLAGHRLLADGTLILIAQTSRYQLANREAALAKLAALVAQSLHPPTPRRPTRPTKASGERRLASKKRESAKKRQRGGSFDE